MTSLFLLFYKTRSREISAAYLVGRMIKASGFIVQLKAEVMVTTGWKPAAAKGRKRFLLAPLSLPLLLVRNDIRLVTLYPKKTSHLAVAKRDANKSNQSTELTQSLSYQLIIYLLLLIRP